METSGPHEPASNPRHRRSHASHHVPRRNGHRHPLRRRSGRRVLRLARVGRRRSAVCPGRAAGAGAVHDHPPGPGAQAPRHRSQLFLFRPDLVRRQARRPVAGDVPGPGHGGQRRPVRRRFHGRPALHRDGVQGRVPADPERLALRREPGPRLPGGGDRRRAVHLRPVGPGGHGRPLRQLQGKRLERPAAEGLDRDDAAVQLHGPHRQSRPENRLRAGNRRQGQRRDRPARPGRRDRQPIGPAGQAGGPTGFR